MTGEQKPKRFDFTGCIVLTVIVVVGAVLLADVLKVGTHPVRARMQINATLFAMALRQYHTEYGVYPEGDDAQVLAALRGGNPGNIVFFQTNLRSINPKGEFVDDWGTPFRFDLSDPKNPRVWSCGKD